MIPAVGDRLYLSPATPWLSSYSRLTVTPLTESGIKLFNKDLCLHMMMILDSPSNVLARTDKWNGANRRLRHFGLKAKGVSHCGCWGQVHRGPPSGRENLIITCQCIVQLRYSVSGSLCPRGLQIILCLNINKSRVLNLLIKTYLIIN